MQAPSDPATTPPAEPVKPSTKRIAIYMRCSSARQDNESQAHEVKKALAERDALPPAVIAAIDSASEERFVAQDVDGVGIYADLHISGRNDALSRRHGWRGFWENRHRHSELVVFNVDRILRAMREQVMIVLTLEMGGCAVTQLSGSGKNKTGNNAADLIVTTLDAIRSQAESDMNSRRTKARFDAMREANGGILPFVGAHVIKPHAKAGYRRMTDAEEQAMFNAYMACDLRAEEMGERFNVPPAYAARALRRVKGKLGYKGHLSHVRTRYGKNFRA